MDVALDANILIRDPWLQSSPVRALLDYLGKTDSYVLLHEVVVAEVKAHFARKCAEDVQKLENALHTAKRRGVMGLPELDGGRLVEETVARWETKFGAVFNSSNSFRLPIGKDHLPELIRRATKRVPPCSAKGEGMRDAIIWLDLLDSARAGGAHGQIAFVSANTADFANPKDRTLLRRELLNDLERHETSIAYYPDLTDFLGKHAEPVSHITSDWIRERLPSGGIEEMIRSRVARPDEFLDFVVAAGTYRDYYEPQGRPDITAVRAQLVDFFVWQYGDEHIELLLIVDAEIEAEMECRRIDVPPSDAYGSEHERELEVLRSRRFPCIARAVFEIPAVVVDDAIEVLESEEPDGPWPYP
jgi:hypothetical protein